MSKVYDSWPPGESEMAGRIRSHDWSATVLGPIECWSSSLKRLVELMLSSQLVSCIVCGSERLLIYNDVAAKLYGHHHPVALGRPLPETFPQGWSTVAPYYERSFAGESITVVSQPLDTRGEGSEATDIFDALLIPVREAKEVAYVYMVGNEVSELVHLQEEILAIGRS